MGKNKMHHLDDSVQADKPGERTSLLDLGEVDLSKEIFIGPDGKVVTEDENKKPFEAMTRQEMLNAREEIADRCFISAVKTICTLQRANDLNAYSRHPRI